MRPILLLLAILPLSIAHAQSEDDIFGPWYLAEAERGWYVDGFLGFEREPTYAGSDSYEVEPDVGVRAFYRAASGRRWYLSFGEVGLYQPVGGRGALVAILEYEEARDADDEPLLAGFDEVDETVELQLSYAHRFGNAHLGGVLQPDLLGRGKGLVLFLGGGYDRTVNERWRYSLSADVSWGDAEHMRTEFGVNPGESTRTGLPEYTPGSAMKSATAGVTIEWSLNRRLSLLGSVEAEHYLSEAAASPLIDPEGTRTTNEASLALRYRFR